MSSGGFARFARRPPSKSTNENAVNDSTHSSAFGSAQPEASTAPSANDFGFESSWDNSGGFADESGGDWLDEGFAETVENHIEPNENQGNQEGFSGIPLFKSKTNSASGASSTTTPSEPTTAPTPESFSGAETKTPDQAPTALSYPSPHTNFHHGSSISKSSTAGREGETPQPTAPTPVATPYPYSNGGRGQFAVSNVSNQSFKHMDLEQGFSSGNVDEREVSMPNVAGTGVASANHHQIDKRCVPAGNVGTSAGVQQYDSNKTPGPTTQPTTTQARSRETNGNTERTAALDSQFPPPVTPATTEKSPNKETPFRGTLSQFDTSLVSPDQNKDGMMEKAFHSNGKSRTSGNVVGTELSSEAVSEETFSQIFLSIKNGQLAFDDGNSVYDDRMLELSSVLCFEHGNMLTFEASCSEEIEDIENVSNLLDNAIASHGIAS